MKIKLNGNSVAVVTDIPADIIGAGAAVFDEDDNQLYKVCVGREPSMSPYGFVANTTVDGKLAAIWFEDSEVNKDAFQQKYTAAVGALQKYSEKIIEAAQQAAATYDAIWADVFED